MPTSRPNLDLRSALLVGWSVVMSVLAQLLLRQGMAGLSELSGLELYRAALVDWHVPAGILSYALGTVSWLAVLSRLDLAVAYPLGSTNYVLVTLLAATVLGESVSWPRWVGTVLILVGVCVIAAGERRREGKTT